MPAQWIVRAIRSSNLVNIKCPETIKSVRHAEFAPLER